MRPNAADVAGGLFACCHPTQSRVRNGTDPLGVVNLLLALVCKCTWRVEKCPAGGRVELQRNAQSNEAWVKCSGC